MIETTPTTTTRTGSAPCAAELNSNVSLLRLLYTFGKCITTGNKKEFSHI